MVVFDEAHVNVYINKLTLELHHFKADFANTEPTLKLYSSISFIIISLSKFILTFYKPRLDYFICFLLYL